MGLLTLEQEDALLKRIKKIKTKKETTKITPKTSEKTNKYELVLQELSKYKDKYIILKTEQELNRYFASIKFNDICSIDTETTGLLYFIDNVVGICLYTPNEKPAYIPVAHINSITKELINDNVSVDLLKKLFSDVIDVKWIFHNACFDITMLYNLLDIRLKCFWDTLVVANIFNSDKHTSHELKDLYYNLVSKDDTIPIKFNTVFNNKVYAEVPPEICYLYAAGDGYKTYKLYEKQLEMLEKEPELYNLYTTLELPVLEPIIDMQINGIKMDNQLNQEFHNKYWDLRNETYQKYLDFLNKHKNEISAYKGNVVLDNPINEKSPKQLGVLFYDILKFPIPKVKGKESRTTDEKTLKSLNNDLCNIILDLRKYDKLIDTYIDKLPTCISPITGNIHPHFNSYGAATGRLSSNDPKKKIGVVKFG